LRPVFYFTARDRAARSISGFNERYRMQSYKNPALDLSAAFKEPTGYLGTCWIDLSDGELKIDQAIPSALEAFLREVVKIVHANDMTSCLIGCAYMRVIDGSFPENRLRWHAVNLPGVRFSTAIATDGAQTNLAWLPDDELVGYRVGDTDWEQFPQSANGDIIVFTTEPHGVLPQPARPGELTVVFFVTLYKSQAEADLYEHHNGHQSRGGARSKACDGACDGDQQVK
jgi:hypothetical protein